jgi:hypothetical protein
MTATSPFYKPGPNRRLKAMRRTLSILLVIGLLAACASALAAPGRGQGQGRGSGSEGGSPPADIGAFSVAATTVTGEHVSFSYSETGIEGFRAQNVTLFDVDVAAEDDAANAPPRAETQARTSACAPTRTSSARTTTPAPSRA